MTLGQRLAEIAEQERVQRAWEAFYRRVTTPGR